MEDVASVVVAAVGAVTGTIGLIVAVWANGQARTANQIAAAAKDEAKRANALSEDANTLSRESNDISLGAKDLAAQANEISRLSQMLETERHEVHWSGNWEAPGKWVYTNEGQHDAHDVHAEVDVDGEKVKAQVGLVPPGGRIILDLPGAAQALAEEQREEHARRQAAAGRVVSIPVMPDMARFTHQINERVSWTTDLGALREHTTSTNLGSLSVD